MDQFSPLFASFALFTVPSDDESIRSTSSLRLLMMFLYSGPDECTFLRIDSLGRRNRLARGRRLGVLPFDARSAQTQ